MTKDEALRLALEALENSVDLVREDAYNAEELYGNYPARQGKVRGLKVLADDHEKAITAIKAALEAKDEPLQSVWNTLPSNKDVEDAMRMKRLNQLSTPPQRTWIGLTDGEISDCMEMSIQKTCRAIEAKLKEKNT
jgi:hypothetical protein